MPRIGKCFSVLDKKNLLREFLSNSPRGRANNMRDCSCGEKCVWVILKTTEQSHPLHYWYYSCGTEDTFYNDSTKMYKSALATVSAFKDEENCRFVEGYGANHTYEFWLTSLYNTLHKFFKD